MRKFTSAIVLSMLAIFASPAKATQIIASSTGLTNPVSIITFEEINVGEGNSVTTQYAGLGVSFNPAFFYTGMSDFGNLTGNDVRNSAPGTGNPTGPFNLNFTTPQIGVAFSIDGDFQPYTFTALLNGTPVDAFNAGSVGVTTNDYYGFSGEKFDSITITPLGADHYFVVDNIQLIPAPEPSGLALLGTGLIGLVGVAKRRLS